MYTNMYSHCDAYTNKMKKKTTTLKQVNFINVCSVFIFQTRLLGENGNLQDCISLKTPVY